MWMEAPTCVSSAPSAVFPDSVVLTVGYDVTPLSIVRSDYDGDDVYADWSEPIPGSSDPPTLLRSFEPGIGRVEPWVASGRANTAYYHTDMLGTTRLMTGADGQPLPGYGTASMPTPATFTAFGERVQGPTDGEGNRYGYVGEHGYQSHEKFPYLHLGARYYDPSMGRFLQRDPIGIRGGANVYAYASASPTLRLDPSGMYDWFEAGKGAFLGFLGAVVTAASPQVVLACAAIGAINGVQRSDVDAFIDSLSVSDYRWKEHVDEPSNCCIHSGKCRCRVGGNHQWEGR